MDVINDLVNELDGFTSEMKIDYEEEKIADECSCVTRQGMFYSMGT